MRIVFTGGGSGGHLYPIVAIARELKRIAEAERILDLQLFYFGPEMIPPDVIREEDILFQRVMSGKIRRYWSWENVRDIGKIALGILIALWKMFVVMPDVVFAKGGYGSFPTLFAARIYLIPVIIHESDSVPGKVNEWAGKWASRIAISFASAASYFPREKIALTGVPVRKRVLAGNREDARETLGVFSNRPVVFITGGSQGARAINQAVLGVLKPLVEKYEVIHQAGAGEYDDLRLIATTILEGANETNYHLASFLDEQKMRAAYVLADLVVSRAGATAIAEIAAWGKPMILIPLKASAQDHQRENAYALAERGAAVVIEQNNLTPSVLQNEIERLMADPERRQRLGAAAREHFAHPDAAETIAREILKLGLH